MIATSHTPICTYECACVCMNGYEMHKLPDVVKVANSSSSFKEEERKDSRLISNVRIIK